MPTDEVVKDTIFDWLKAILAYADDNIIRADENGPRPTGAYATFTLMDSVPSDYSEAHKTSLSSPDDLGVTYENKHTLTVQVDIYNDENAEDLHRKLNQSGNLLAIRLILQAVKIVLRGSGSIRNLTGLGDTVFNPRFSCDYTFALSNELGEQYERITEYEIDGTFIP